MTDQQITLHKMRRAPQSQAQHPRVGLRVPRRGRQGCSRAKAYSRGKVSLLRPREIPRGGRRVRGKSREGDGPQSVQRRSSSFKVTKRQATTSHLERSADFVLAKMRGLRRYVMACIIRDRCTCASIKLRRWLKGMEETLEHSSLLL